MPKKPMEKSLNYRIYGALVLEDRGRYKKILEDYDQQLPNY